MHEENQNRRLIARFKRMWKDPVWSNVIAAGVIGTFGFVAVQFTSFIDLLNRAPSKPTWQLLLVSALALLASEALKEKLSALVRIPLLLLAVGVPMMGTSSPHGEAAVPRDAGTPSTFEDAKANPDLESAYSLSIVNNYDNADANTFNTVRFGIHNREYCPPNKKLQQTVNCEHAIPKGETYFKIDRSDLVRKIYVRKLDGSNEEVRANCTKDKDGGLHCDLTGEKGSTVLPQ